MAEVTLSPVIQSALQTNRAAAASGARAANRLALGRQILSALDGAQAFSKSVSLSNRASDLLGAKNNIDLGISSLSAANAGLGSIERLLEQTKSVAQQFNAAQTTEEQTRLQAEFNTLTGQIDSLAGDTSFLGRNLIGPTPGGLEVDFGGGSSLEVAGQASDSASLGVTLNVDAIDAAIATVRANQSAIGFGATVLQVREDFTTGLVANLQEGAANLVNADLEAEAATVLSSRTRQQLSQQAITIATQSERSILSLF